jgi:hydroxylamine reductase (hybrid-cluster protein)
MKDDTYEYSFMKYWGCNSVMSACASLPAFITPNILEVLVQNFNIMPKTSAEKAIKAILRYIEVWQS